jgi:phage tail-like protein
MPFTTNVLTAHNFKVDYGTTPIPNVRKIGEIADETDSLRWGEGAQAVAETNQRHGLTVTRNIRIERYLDAKDNALRDIWKQLRDGAKGEDLAKPLVVQLINENVGANKVQYEVTLHNAWMCKYGISELDAHSKGTVTEYAEFAGEHLEVKPGK